MKRSSKEVIVRMVILFIGLSIAHLGVTLFLLADLGADPFNVFVQGLFRTLQKVPFLSNFKLLTHGNTHVVISCIIIIVLLFVDRSYIKIGTVFCMIFGGPIIDFFTWFLGGMINNTNPMPIRIVVVALGCVVLSYGMTIVMKSDAGVGPNDLVAISISDKGHFPFGRTRIVVDVSFVVIGFALSGSIGIGTIICAFLVGLVAEKFLPINQKFVDYILKKAAI